jgi:hypothetical protein
VNGFRRLRLLAELVGVADRAPDDRLELAAAAARRALAPSDPCAQDPVGALGHLGAAIFARVPCAVVLTFAMPDGKHQVVGLEYDGSQVLGQVKVDEDRTPWQGILRALREGLGPKGQPLAISTLDAFRDAIESWSYTGTCRAGHAPPVCKDPGCHLARGGHFGN